MNYKKRKDKAPNTAPFPALRGCFATCTRLVGVCAFSDSFFVKAKLLFDLRHHLQIKKEVTWNLALFIRNFNIAQR